MRLGRSLALAALVLAFGAAPSRAHFKNCPKDSVKVGTTCLDTYEASAWLVPDPQGKNRKLVKLIEKGKATLAGLTAAGAVQVGCALPPYEHAAYPPGFPLNGSWTTPVYAVSIPGVLPTACTTWFQADQACALSGKRLATNEEWQRAAASTPDTGADDGATLCNTEATGQPALTGSRASCVSAWGAFDMAGNVWEWVADWQEETSDCDTWSSLFGNDRACFGGAPGSADDSDNLPAAINRGGTRNIGTNAGIFAINAYNPEVEDSFIGFRCAR